MSDLFCARGAVPVINQQRVNLNSPMILNQITSQHIATLGQASFTIRQIFFLINQQPHKTASIFTHQLTKVLIGKRAVT